MKKFQFFRRKETSHSEGMPLTAIPDAPIPFGYKTSWLCVKAQDSGEAIRALNLRNPQPADWESGYRAHQAGKIFVSPSIGGYVLILGYDRDGMKDMPDGLQELSKVGKLFPQVQLYASHRVVDYAAWVKWEDGQLIRAYGWCGDQGEVLMNEGEVTPEERQIGMGNPLTDALGTEDWDAFDMPDEEDVVELAALWGVDPLFRGEYPKSTGFVCDR